MVLAQAVADDVLPASPADYVKLPTDRNTGRGAVVDDPALFLTPVQVAALVAATPWPFSVQVHLAAWSGLRAAELAGLRVDDVIVPPAPLNPNAAAKPGTVRVEQTIAWTGATHTAMAPKTKGSRRTVPLTPATTALLRDYLAVHPRAEEPDAALFPNMALTRPRPTGVAAPTDDTGDANLVPVTAARRQAQALAELTTAETGERLVLDWTAPVLPRRLLQGCLPACRLAREPVREGDRDGERRATPGTQVPRAPPHLRELDDRGGPTDV